MSAKGKFENLVVPSSVAPVAVAPAQVVPMSRADAVDAAYRHLKSLTVRGIRFADHALTVAPSEGDPYPLQIARRLAMILDAVLLDDSARVRLADEASRAAKALAQMIEEDAGMLEGRALALATVEVFVDVIAKAAVVSKPVAPAAPMAPAMGGLF